MFSRLFKTPKSSLQLFRKNQAAMLPNDAESPQFPSENFSSLPIIWKVGLIIHKLTAELGDKVTLDFDSQKAVFNED